MQNAKNKVKVIAIAMILVMMFSAVSSATPVTVINWPALLQGMVQAVLTPIVDQAKKFFNIEQRIKQELGKISSKIINKAIPSFSTSSNNLVGKIANNISTTATNAARSAATNAFNAAVSKPLNIVAGVQDTAQSYVQKAADAVPLLFGPPSQADPAKMTQAEKTNAKIEELRKTTNADSYMCSAELVGVSEELRKAIENGQFDPATDYPEKAIKDLAAIELAKLKLLTLQAKCLGKAGMANAAHAR